MNFLLMLLGLVVLVTSIVLSGVTGSVVFVVPGFIGGFAAGFFGAAFFDHRRSRKAWDRRAAR